MLVYYSGGTHVYVDDDNIITVTYPHPSPPMTYTYTFDGHLEILLEDVIRIVSPTGLSVLIDLHHHTIAEMNLPISPTDCVAFLHPRQKIDVLSAEDIPQDEPPKRNRRGRRGHSHRSPIIPEVQDIIEVSGW